MRKLPMKQFMIMCCVSFILGFSTAMLIITPRFNDTIFELEMEKIYIQSQLDYNMHVISELNKFNVPYNVYESVIRWSELYNLNHEFILGLIKHESNFYQWKRGAHGEIGVMQVRKIAALDIIPGITEGELWDIDTNIMIGISYFRSLLDKYDQDYRIASIAYNRGPGKVDELLRLGIDPANGYYLRVSELANGSF